jgi:hypothetical protein
MSTMTNGERCAVNGSQNTFVSQQKTSWKYSLYCRTIEESTLGINVKPSEVHSNPTSNDPYAWKILPEKTQKLLKDIRQESKPAFHQCIQRLKRSL